MKESKKFNPTGSKYYGICSHCVRGLNLSTEVPCINCVWIHRSERLENPNLQNYWTEKEE